MKDNNEWQTFEKSKPEYNKKVIVFRFKMQKHTIATLFIDERDEDDNLVDTECWATEHGSVHTAHPKDVWLSFPAITVEKVYSSKRD